MYFEIVVFAVFLLAGFYKWATYHFDFFEKRGIPYLKPFPLVGNMGDMVLRRISMFDLVINYYNKFDSKVFGIFDQRIPLLVIKDPAIVKQITVKDFDHFVNHREIFASTDINDDSNLFGSSLFQMKDSKWKDMRSTLSPAFTGKKMREMFALMNDVAQETVSQLKRIPETQNGYELDVKDYTTCFTSDIIASTAFGLKVNSVKDKNNEFYKMGKKVTTFTPWQNIKFFLWANFKPIMKLFKMEIFDKDSSAYFKRIVLDAMKHRKEQHIIRPDMIHMLMEARGIFESDHPKGREWTDTEMVAQCFLFFFAGFETASLLMCFALHELMENPKVQEALYNEVRETCETLDGQQISYEKLHSMQYMDMVVSETLRKWPPAIALDRLCTKDFVYEADGERIQIKRGENIWIPACGFHRDPQYFPDPNKFDPERFNAQNKDSINPFVYMPFGLGPRSCIANRFALLEAKALLYYMIRDFKFEAAKKSSVPLVLSKAGFQLVPVNGFWLKVTRRS